jgi:hypothetical protein
VAGPGLPGEQIEGDGLGLADVERRPGLPPSAPAGQRRG